MSRQPFQAMFGASGSGGPAFAGVDAFQFSRTIRLDANASADAIAAGKTFTTLTAAVAAALALTPTANSLVLIDCNLGTYIEASTGSPITIPSGVFIRGYGMPGAFNTTFRGTVFEHSATVAGDTGFLEFEAFSGMANVTTYVNTPPANFTTQYNMVDCNNTGLGGTLAAHFEDCTFTMVGTYNGANPLTLLAATGETPSLGSFTVVDCLVTGGGTGVTGIDSVAQTSLETVRISTVSNTRSCYFNVPGDVVNLRNVSFNTKAARSTYYIEAEDNTKIDMWDTYVPQSKRLSSGTGLAEWSNYNAGAGQSRTPYKVIVFADSPYTVLPDDRHLDVDATAGAVVINLPPVADAQFDSESDALTVAKTDISANIVTVDGDAAETINGAATKVLNARYQNIRVMAVATEWREL